MEHTLLLGGDTPSDDYSATLELITPNLACTPNMPILPVRRQSASATVLGSTIFYCGGYLAGFTPEYHGTCHSYLLGKEGERWEEEESMNHARRYFSLTVINDRIYAVGGQTDKGKQNSVESFSHSTGWQIEESMQMANYRYLHCSVALGTRLIVLGGRLGSEAQSLSVQAFDTSLASLNTTASWENLANMNYARESFGCSVGVFEGLEGIYAAGSYDYPTLVEFYAPDIDAWRNIDPLNTGRSYHTLTIINGQMVVAGGNNEITSVETLNGTEWVETNNLKVHFSHFPCNFIFLKVGRDMHAAVVVPAGALSCQMS